MTATEQIKQLTPDGVKRLARPAWKRYVNARHERDLVGPVFRRQAELRDYKRELLESQLADELAAKQAEFQASVSGVTARGAKRGFGAITTGSRLRIYALARALKPSVLVETGVCNGVSSAVTLEALSRNGHGRLHSIDFPEYAESGTETGHWDGKGGAVVAPGRESGWVVPERLRGSWDLALGRSQDLLPDLLEQLGEIDWFFHDSEHSYECMTFEFEAAYDRLRPGGFLLADDIAMNTSFFDFAEAKGKEALQLGEGIGLIIR